MIVVSLGAGLGNQMFEYAYFFNLKKKYPDIEIKLDPRYAFPLAHNGIEIFDIFKFNDEIATKEEVISLTKGYRLSGDIFEKRSILNKISNKIRKCPSTMRIQADYTEFFPDMLNIDSNKSFYMYGVFANYKYFKDIESDIKRLYSFPLFSDDINRQYENQIINCNSVSIHIRRGDYITSGIQLVTQDYYYAAINKIMQKEDNVKFFVFTDDISFATSLFGEKDNFIIVKGNDGKNSFRDMQLMSLCKHNIIANSTFSFWGAFLNSYKGKIVIAPNLAFSGTKFPFACDDWIMI